MDPRVHGIRRMLSGIRRIWVVLSPKGGVGKTLVSVCTAIGLAREGRTVGLLDADVTNPTAHIPLGVDPSGVELREEEGVVPVRAKGVLFMSPVFFTEDRALPLRGWEISSILRELLAITNWGRLDCLVVDTPPGLADETLELLLLLPRKEAILVSTPSPMASTSARRMEEFLRDEGIPLLAHIENMSPRGIPYYPNLDAEIGHIEGTEFCRKVSEIIRSAQND